MERCDSLGTPLTTKPKLDADLSGIPVDQIKYRSKIGSLIYLTSSRPDIVQAYPKDSSFELTAISDADHIGCLDTRKSTYRGIQFLGDKLVSKSTYRGIQFLGVKESRLYCNVISRSRIRGVIRMLCSSNVDEDTT
ncbi:retrovirus-related pol polyprotein from transposon TNT 1-94 [Tanacetum coccineum]